MPTKDASVTIEFSNPNADVERAFDEQLDVVGHALVGVVGRVALKLHPVVVGIDAAIHRDSARSSSAASGSAAID